MIYVNRHIVMVAVSAILYGGITAGGDFLLDHGLSVYEISVYTLLLVLLALTPYVATRRELMLRKDLIVFYLVYGLIGALLQLTSFSALFLGVPVAIVAMLLNTQPIWTTLIGHFWLKEYAGKREIAAMGVAMIGVVILLEPWEAERVGQATGILLSLAGGLSLSLWIIWGRRGGLSEQHGVTITLGYAFFTLIALMIFYPLVLLLTDDDRLVRLSFALPANSWIFLLLYVLCANLIPHLLFFTGIKMVRAVTAGMLLLLEPVSAAMLAVILFGQELTPFMFAGGVLILFSNFFILERGKDES